MIFHAMKNALVSLQLLAVSAVVPGEIDRVCRNGECTVLAIQHGRVRLIETMRNLVIGNYIGADQHFVPPTEAPIRDLLSSRRWHIVVSAFLDHGEQSAGLHVRFFSPNGMLRGTADILMHLEQADIGHLFGGADDILAVTSDEEHAYNTQTDIWLLPEAGDPKLLLSLPGVYQKLSASTAGGAPGVFIARQTYDGVHAETKGTVLEFYAWNSGQGVLTLQKQ